MSSSNYYKPGLTALALAATVAFAPTSSAALATYTQSFEGREPNQGGAEPDSTTADCGDIEGVRASGVGASQSLGPRSAIRA